MDLSEMTVIHESMDGDELEMQMFMLERARAQFAWKCGGLDAEALDKPLPPSTMTIGGLLKHVALCEDMRIAEFLTGDHMPEPWKQENFDADPQWDWHSAANDTPEELYALWRASVERSRAAWATVLENGGLDQPSIFTTEEGGHPNLRRVLVDATEHYLRHTGHADLLRENIDGLVGEDPPQPAQP
ncbi:DUF664 domain-containing protein [Jiangella ureilytica]|uniref:DUF664 domain-containing protein n=1 Tax=Jiangella ureilytica TaxID=2530374 RepID=A0A4R4S3X4_9ACTN|nr:DUF664 domain-containing protein [Jiangella ureilytica]TDC56714.1 DUF664 domain-containing protein [Jiangella ureilytica]